MRCKSFRDVKIREPEEWRADHAGHGGITKNYGGPQPPAGYRLVREICACGQTLITSEEVGADENNSQASR